MPAKSKKQQRFMGMVHAYQKGELKDAPKSIKKAAGSMTKKAAKDFAETKHKGLPEKVKEDINVAEDFKSMTFKEYLAIDEGLLDFAKGAAREVGKKVAALSPIQATKDVFAAGKTASLDATKKRAAQVAAQAAQLVAQMGPQGEPMLLAMLRTMGQPGELGIKLYMQGKAAAGVQQQQQQPQRQQQQAPARSSHEQTADALRARRSAGLVGASFDLTVDGKDVLSEAIGARLGGMARAAAEKTVGAIDQVAERNPLKGLADIWRAGKAASTTTDANKKLHAIAKQLVQLATALHKAGANKQAAAPAGA